MQRAWWAIRRRPLSEGARRGRRARPREFDGTCRSVRPQLTVAQQFVDLAATDPKTAAASLGVNRSLFIDSSRFRNPPARRRSHRGPPQPTGVTRRPGVDTGGAELRPGTVAGSSSPRSGPLAPEILSVLNGRGCNTDQPGRASLVPRSSTAATTTLRTTTDGRWRGRCVSGARLRGDRVTQLRRAAGQRQVDLASRLGTREQRVGEWERGTQQPHPRQLVALARELQVQPLQLLDVDADDPPLQALRLAAGLTLQEMAEASGLAFSTYRRLEVGAVRRSPSPADA